MKNFEEKLQRLEQIGSDIKRSDVTLEEALKYFQEGITWPVAWKRNWTKSKERFKSS